MDDQQVPGALLSLFFVTGSASLIWVWMFARILSIYRHFVSSLSGPITYLFCCIWINCCTYVSNIWQYVDDSKRKELS
ncbi:hypothetical protein BRADI_5g26711v3 [Brachypodium distachyon]|uniref:Uncharacterized protein n=1 Tax=Brachypodium distachyon TaxID=15368 RepID=A0A0Q3KZ79_BRADI|nr:hypothetical protein BRADI_5g26711v3 [Brachypodium distachyon]